MRTLDPENGSSWTAQEQEGDQQWQERYDREQGLEPAASKEDVDYGSKDDVSEQKLGQMAVDPGVLLDPSKAIGTAFELMNPPEEEVNYGKDSASLSAGLPMQVSAADTWQRKFGKQP